MIHMSNYIYTNIYIYISFDLAGLNPIITFIGVVVLVAVCVPTSIVLVKKRNELNCLRRSKYMGGTYKV